MSRTSRSSSTTSTQLTRGIVCAPVHLSYIAHSFPLEPQRYHPLMVEPERDPARPGARQAPGRAAESDEGGDPWNGMGSEPPPPPRAAHSPVWFQADLAQSVAARQKPGE